MLIKIGDFECTEVWDGVFYKKLSNYPNVSDWEIRTIIEFIEYEKKYGRICDIECDNEITLQTLLTGIEQKEAYLSAPLPKLLTECTACRYRKGCVTDFVCHTTSVDNAIKIFQCGKLLSARKARKVPVEILMSESRNAANDPADFFEYIIPKIRKVDYVIGMNVYCWGDSDSCYVCGQADCPVETGWGLVDGKGNPKPAYYAVQKAYEE